MLGNNKHGGEGYFTGGRYCNKMRPTKLVPCAERMPKQIATTRQKEQEKDEDHAKDGNVRLKTS